jgi:hypothetical protein
MDEKLKIDSKPPAKIPNLTNWRTWIVIAAGAGMVLAPDLSNFDILLNRHNLGWILHALHCLGGILLLAVSWKRLERWLPASTLWNRILFATGIINIITPDLTGLAAWLSSLHIGWLTHVAHVIGGAALVASNWNRIIGKIAEKIPESEEKTD